MKSLQKLGQLARSLGKKPKELRAEEKRQRLFVKETLWPYLVEHTKSVPEAKKLLQMATFMLRTSGELKIKELQKQISDSKISDFQIAKDFEGKDYAPERELLFIFKDEKTEDAVRLLGGMAQAVDSFINKEMKDRKVESLSTEFL